MHYDKYSSEYDNMQTMTGFNDPYEIVKVCVSELGSFKEVRICDFGCGTGLLGEELKKQGFTDVCGIDGSSDMLKIADSKGVYKQTWKVLVGLDQLPAEALYTGEGTGFDIVVCSACMIKGHFPNSCYEEFLKVLTPGGFFVFSIRDIYLDSATDNGMDFVGKLA